MTADSDIFYTYLQIDDLTLDNLTAHLKDNSGVVNVTAQDKWGWRCEVCHLDSGAVFHRALATQMHKAHGKTQAHRRQAQHTPTRFTN